jgi:hypothetical protein
MDSEEVSSVGLFQYSSFRDTSLLVQCLMEDGEVVESPSFISFGTAEHDDLHAHCAADSAATRFPWGGFKCLTVEIGSILLGVIEDFVLTQGRDSVFHAGGASIKCP